MSLRADQANDRVSYTASAPPAPATAFTATFWARLRVDLDTFSTMMRLHSASGGTTTVTVASNSSGTVPAVFSPGNTGGIVGSDALVVDQWRMIAVSISGTGATGGRMYTRTVGGSTNVSTGQVSGGSVPDGLTLFGRSPSDSSEWFNGSLAHVRVWSAVLTQSEIEAEWASTTPVRTAGLWAAWPLATDLTDTSGNGRTLTAGLTALTVEDDPPITASTDVTGAGAGAFGGLTGAVAGTRGVTGAASAGFGALAATAGAPTLVTGSASAALGGLTAAARGTQPTTQGGSWYGLLSILSEAVDMVREEAQQQPVACLDCGEPLRTGPRGELYCPFDGQIWAAGNRRVGTVTAGRR